MRNDGRYPTRLAAKTLVHLQIFFYTMWLRAVNLYSRRLIISDSGIDVSITTYGARTRQVWKAIESIGRGSLLPHSIVLWHEDEAIVRNPPRALRRLVKRGLKIKHCVDYGPHKKYFPYVMEESLDRLLATADDDVLYPRSWLAGLLAVHRADQADQVVAYRARTMNDNSYMTWPLCTTTTASENIIATGVSGVLYPPRVLEALRRRGDAFMQVCPRADDFWLHYAAVAAGIPTRQVTDVAATWWPIRPKQRGLMDYNLAEGGNDAISMAARQAWLSPPA